MRVYLKQLLIWVSHPHLFLLDFGNVMNRKTVPDDSDVPVYAPNRIQSLIVTKVEFLTVPKEPVYRVSNLKFVLPLAPYRRVLRDVELVLPRVAAPLEQGNVAARVVTQHEPLLDTASCRYPFFPLALVEAPVLFEPWLQVLYGLA